MLSFMRPISRQCVGHALGTWYRDRLHLGTMKCFGQTVLLPAESQSGCYCLFLTGFLYKETQDSSFDANTRSMCPFECNRSNHKEYPSILDIRSASSIIPNSSVCVVWVWFRFLIMISFGTSSTLEMLFLKHVSSCKRKGLNATRT